MKKNIVVNIFCILATSFCVFGSDDDQGRSPLEQQPTPRVGIRAIQHLGAHGPDRTCPHIYGSVISARAGIFQSSPCAAENPRPSVQSLVEYFVPRILDARLSAAHSQLGADLNAQFNELGTRFNAQFNRLENRLNDRLNARISELEAQLNARLNARITELEAKLDDRVAQEFNKKVEGLKASIEAPMRQRVDAWVYEIDKNVRFCRTRMDQLEQNSRRLRKELINENAEKICQAEEKQQWLLLKIAEIEKRINGVPVENQEPEGLLLVRKDDTGLLPVRKDVTGLPPLDLDPNTASTSVAGGGATARPNNSASSASDAHGNQ